MKAPPLSSVHVHHRPNEAPQDEHSLLGGVETFFQGLSAHAPGEASPSFFEQAVGLVKGAVKEVRVMLPELVALPAQIMEGPKRPQGNPTSPADRAEYLWQAIQDNLSLPLNGGLLRSSRGAVIQSSVWSFGQAIAAKEDLVRLTGQTSGLERMLGSLSIYQRGDAYAPGPIPGPRYYDDNAWVALDWIQAYEETRNPEDLAKAREVFGFLKTGIHLGKHPCTNLYWCEDLPKMSRNTCSNGPAMEVALRLALIAKEQAATTLSPHAKAQDLDEAARNTAFAEELYRSTNQTLESPSGLYWDQVQDSGRVGKDFYTYNQGTPIGADVLFYRLTGDATYLAHAERVANATLAHFGQRGPDGHTGFWHQPPCFNAIFFRNLMALNAVSPHPAYVQALKDYLDEAWSHARDPATGFLDQGGIGTYGNDRLIDQSAFVQMFALLAKLQDFGMVA
jgi:hypothetical protein